MLRHLLDILVALVAIVILTLPMLIIAVLIRAGSRGRAVFRQRRVGWRGKCFTMLKFRTMRADIDPYGVSPHCGDDPRLTRIGKVLRETSMDELPQLFNVLVGQMSIVGPRPLYERQAAKWDQRQRGRLDVRPGMTGYAQAYGGPVLTHEDKIEMDLYYVAHQSIWLDMKIVMRTMKNMFSGQRQIYEHRYSRDKERETD